MICKNCEYTISETTNYCPDCGAKVIRKRLNAKNLWSEFSEKFFNYDNKIFKTLKHLVTQPEDVIDGFMKGVRKKYINPISYYTIALTLSGLIIFLTKKFFPQLLVIPDSLNPQDNPFAKDPGAIYEYQTLMGFASIPFYALISKIIFLRQKHYNYIEHLIIFFYTFAQLSFLNFFIWIITAFIGINFFTFSYLMFPIMILYNAYVLKRVFKLSSFEIILKTFFFMIILGVSFIIFSILLVAFMKYTGMFEALIVPEN